MTTRDPRHNGEADALPRDEALSRVYRGQIDAAPAGPPAALDARILTAAREAVAAPRRPARAPLPWWRRLMVPASVAAVLVVSATLTLMVHDEQQKLEAPAPAAAPRAAPESAPPPSAPPGISAPTQAPVQSRESAAEQLPEAIPAERNAPAASTLSKEAPAAIAPETKAKAAKRAEESATDMRRIEAAPATEAVPRPAPSVFPVAAPSAPPPAPPVNAASGAGATPGAAVGGAVAPASPRSERESRVRQMREAAPLPQAAPVAPAAATPPSQGVAAEPTTPSQDALERPARPEMRKGRDVARSPEAWLEEIRQLRRSGREAEWREALERFRVRYPDYPLPEDLR